MKPLRLEMTGIGPFLEKTVIAFEKLPDHSLFLIHGATGRGKSFIFDAICYVLYGETPSGREHNLKSDFAEPGLAPCIRFAFELGGEVYRVERTLAHDRPKLRGEGLTEEPESLQLDRIADWPHGKIHTLATRKTDVNQRLRQCIGLDLAQFQQVVLLPQGEFRRLLLADSRQREELLENLFDASFYQQIQNEVESRSRDERRAGHDLMIKSTELLKQAADQLPEDLRPEITDDATTAVLSAPQTAFEERLATAGKQKHACEQARDKAAKQYTEADALLKQFQRLQTHTEKQEQLKKEAAAMAALQTELQAADRAARLVPVDQQRQTTEKQIKTLTDELQTAAKELETQHAAATAAARKRDAETPKLDEQIQTDRRHLDQLTDLHEIVENQVATTAALQQEETKLQTAKTKRTKCRNELEACRGKQKRWRREIDETADQTADQGRLNHEIDCLKRLQGWVHEQKQLQQDLTQYKTSLAAAKTDVAQAREHYEELRQRREANLAAELAVSLKPETPCPVCGSREHPKPAHSKADAATPDMVDKAEKHAQQKRKIREKAEQKLGQVETKRNTIQGSLEELQTAEPWLDTTRLDEQLDERQNALKQAQENHSRLEDRRKNLLELEKTRLPAAERANEQAEKDERQAEQDYISAKAKHQAVQQQIHDSIPEDLQKQLGQNPTAEAMQKLETELTEQWERRKTQRQALRNLVAETEKAEERAAEKLAGLKKQQSGQHKLLQDFQKKFKQALQASAFDDEEQFRQACREDEWLQTTRETLDEYKSKTTAVEAQCKEIREAIGDREKPEIEAFANAAREAEAAFQAAAEEYTAMRLQQKQIGNALKKLAQWESDAADIRNKLRVLGRLDKRLRGQDQPKISFKRFFLAQRLEEVLLQASRRMQVLSSGRFILKRAAGGRTAAQQTGLDLLVSDSHTGTERPVNTLSGGQLFLASLAMALGLADVVQARSGGIRLDTLFIDEGFGSLDEETLELAMKVLNELRRGRMVGVISHVTELRRQIANRIEVDEADIGSKVRLYLEDN